MRFNFIVFLYIFILFELYFSQSIDDTIIINDYAYKFIDHIPINIDETGNNTYYLNKYNSNFTSDYKINSLFLDGSLTIPLGTYFVPKILPIGNYDTLNNYSQIYYRKGDYDYSDLGIALVINTSDNREFKYNGYKSSPARLYQSSSNQIQNHLINYEMISNNSNFNLDLLYHNEDYKIPISSNITRRIESFHGGFSYSYSSTKLQFSINPSYQFTHINQINQNIDCLTFWNQYSSVLMLSKRLYISLEYLYKLRISELGDQLEEQYFNNITSKLEYNNNSLLLGFGLSYLNSKLLPIGNISYKLNPFSLSFRIVNDISFQPVISPLVMSEYSLYSYELEYNLDNIKTNVELFTSNEKSTWDLIASLDINYSWLDISQELGFYNVFNNSPYSEPLSKFFNTNIILSPNIWFWEDSRYQPFIGIESIVINHTGLRIIQPFGYELFNESNQNPFSTNLLSIEYGFLVKGFKISYRYINFGNQKNNNIPNAYPIPPIRHLEIMWQFIN